MLETTKPLHLFKTHLYVDALLITILRRTKAGDCRTAPKLPAGGRNHTRLFHTLPPFRPSPLLSPVSHRIHVVVPRPWPSASTHPCVPHCVCFLYHVTDKRVNQKGRSVRDQQGTKAAGKVGNGGRGTREQGVRWANGKQTKTVDQR